MSDFLTMMCLGKLKEARDQYTFANVCACQKKCQKWKQSNSLLKTYKF